ncbi:MAG: AAA family ATPase [Acidimicrobiia bacterium]
MRPLRLHLAGFGAFSQPTELDFTDVELFALTGPTGSGKTTVLDGICFALYGSVPRHGKGKVAPVITQGQMEATVGLDFAVGDTTYRVARRVRKSARSQNANTDEASLESEGHTIAIRADPVTQAVTTLLGLDFDQFTTCVLLPQGEFARFLHDKPSQRQDLLTALLDLGIYERVSNLATGRQRLAEGRLDQIEAELRRLGEVTTLDLETAQAREKELGDLLLDVDERLPAIETLTAAVGKAEASLQLASEHAVLLAALEPPAGWREVGSEVADLAEAEAAARLEFEAGRAELDEVVAAGAAFPARADVQAWIRARSELVLVEQERDTAAAAIASLSAQAVEARRLFEVAVETDRAAHLRRGLKPGDPCPVCGETITRLPRARAAGYLEKLDAAASKAQATYDEQRHRLQGLELRAGELNKKLEGVAPDLDHVWESLAQHDAALAAVRTRVGTAVEQLAQHEKRLVKLAERRERVAEAFQAAWSRAAPLQPPFPDGGWPELLAWRDKLRVDLQLQLTELEATLSNAKAQRDSAQRDLVEMVRGLGVEVGARPIRDVVVESHVGARTKREQVAAALEDAARCTQEREEAAADKELARQLTLVLRADKFRKWLFDEVFAALVSGANKLLADLTRGQYQLAMAGRDFEVIDHLSAGNRRSVKTLSGGETFLVSLALAIALAEEVATSAGAIGLDSFFLDEGFGTLDAESLEVVAGVIADLGAQGKLVGIVTHVAELAEQMPVRYEIRKGAQGASVGVATG